MHAYKSHGVSYIKIGVVVYCESTKNYVIAYFKNLT